MNLSILISITFSLFSLAHASSSTQVTGQWFVIDRSGRSAPAQKMMITIETTQGQVIAEGVTDESGRFLISLDQTPNEVRARIRSRSSAHRVIGNTAKWGGEYTYVSEPQRIIADRLNTIRDSRYNALIAANEGRNGKFEASVPFLIAQDLHQVSQFLGKKSTQGDLTVYWSSSGAPKAGYDKRTRTTYLSAGTPSLQDTVTSLVPALLDNGGNLTSSGSCLPRPADDVPWDAVCAYQAGVADFLWMAVNQSSLVSRPNGRIVQFEFDPNFYPNGPLVSGRVAATLWDLLDPANESGDHLMLPFSAIWEVINESSAQLGPIVDFTGFMTAFSQLHPAQSSDWALLLEWNGQVASFKRQSQPEEEAEF